jgi:hypothetical protein
MIKKTLLIFLMSGFVALSAQNPASRAYDEKERGYLSRDNRVDVLQDAHRRLNRQAGMNGFRVQIYTDSGNRSKLRTDRVKAEFDARYPNVPSYISYNEPDYRLRVGDFRTRLDALRFLNEISSTYLSAIIVVDKINFPPLETDIKKTTGTDGRIIE